jgi:hypothetical protein
MQYQFERLERRSAEVGTPHSRRPLVRSRDGASGFERESKASEGAPCGLANFREVISVKEHKFGRQCSVVRRLHDAGRRRDC